MPLPFRIRKPNIDSRDKYQHAQDLYFCHLDSFQNGPGTDLWKFFGWDFFHDGKITSFKFNPDLSEVQMQIKGCNFRTFDDSGDFNYEEPMDFVCTFRNVLKFSIDQESSENFDVRKRSRPTYLYSEINTALPKSSAIANSQYSSLLIQALGCEDYIWVKIIFKELNVLPKDHARFEQLQSNPKTDSPLFCPHT